MVFRVSGTKKVVQCRVWVESVTRRVLVAAPSRSLKKVITIELRRFIFAQQLFGAA